MLLPVSFVNDNINISEVVPFQGSYQYHLDGHETSLRVNLGKISPGTQRYYDQAISFSRKWSMVAQYLRLRHISSTPSISSNTEGFAVSLRFSNRRGVESGRNQISGIRKFNK